MIKNGAPTKKIENMESYWTHDMDQNGPPKVKKVTRVESTLKDHDVKKMGMFIKDNNQWFNRNSGGWGSIKDFNNWADKYADLAGPFQSAIKTGDINNMAPEIQNMKSHVSTMAKCLKADKCRAKFIEHTKDTWEANH